MVCVVVRRAQLVESCEGVVYANSVLVDSDGLSYRFLSLELTAGDSGSSSWVYGVEGGAPGKIEVSGRGLRELDEVTIMGCSIFRGGNGHAFELHKMFFDSESFSLAEGKSLRETSQFEVSVLCGR